MSDRELLQQYLQNGSEAAFAELVGRYVDFVHSTARRQVHDDQTAEEVTQTVFCLLARKARGLTGYPTLGGWFYRATCFTAAKAKRADQRRRRREQEAGGMNLENAGTEEAWDHLAPMLDAAINHLGEQDRLAVLLRFFQQKPMREVGLTLGVSEAAAKMRIARAVDRLRDFFGKRGVACTSAGLAVLLAEKSVAAAPAALARRITTNASAGTASAVSVWQIVSNLGGLLRIKLTTFLVVGTGLLALIIAGMHLHTWFVKSGGKDGRESGGPISQTQIEPNRGGGRTGRAARIESGSISTTSAAPVNLDELIADLRAALHATNSSVCPGAEVVDAVKQFGPRADVAFAILKEEAAARDDQVASTEVSQLAPHRAISGMGFLGKSVPEAVPLLWEIYQSGEKKTDSAGFLALAALSNLGFEPSDIALLSERVLAAAFETHSDAFVKSQVASWVAEIIKKNPETAKRFLPAVENLLESPDAGIRFWAACALIERVGTTNPKVFAEITAGLKSADKERLGWASEEVFKTMGDPAKPIVPALLAAAQAMDDEMTRSWALRAAGNIDPDLRKEIPELDKVLLADEKEKVWLDKINSGSATMDDLLPALKEPANAYVAAAALGQMGASATNALPEMVNALQGQDESEHFDEILEAIRKIDPQAALAPTDRESVQVSIFQTLTGKENVPVEKIFNLFKGHATWCTQQGVSDFAKLLAAEDAGAGQAFVATVLEKKPGWNGLFQPQQDSNVK